MNSFYQRLAVDETAGSTTEWLLVSGVSMLLFGTIGMIVNLMISYIFIRSAIVVATPFG
ncbi:MAG: hypothetical protein ACYTFY_06325 [Planctomycetota bacterium]|jgi:uncharacterized protein YacL